MIITSTIFPANITETCPTCTGLGYTTTLQTQEGDGSLIQTVANGAVTGLQWTLVCPGCQTSFSGTLTSAQLKTATAKTHPNLIIDPVVKATLAGVVYAPLPS